MGEFEEKLNALLSNPDALSQVMNLAQSLDLGGGSNGGPPSENGGPYPLPRRPPPADRALEIWEIWRDWGTCWGRSTQS